MKLEGNGTGNWQGLPVIRMKVWKKCILCIVWIEMPKLVVVLLFFAELHKVKLPPSEVRLPEVCEVINLAHSCSSLPVPKAGLQKS